MEGNTILVKRNICRWKTVLRKKFGVVVIFIPFQDSVDRFRKVDRSNLWGLQGKSVSYPDPATIPESLLHIPMRRERETLTHIQPTDCYYEIRSLVGKRNMDDHSDHFS